MKKYRIICICVSNLMHAYTNEKLINIILKKNPNLPLHRCKNKSGKYFMNVMNKTYIAHLFEHLVIDLQTKITLEVTNSLNKDLNKSIIGTTKLIDKKNLVFQVEFSYFNDSVAIECITKANKIINDAIATISDD